MEKIKQSEKRERELYRERIYLRNYGYFNYLHMDRSCRM